jgi:chaperonin GroES
MSRIVPVNDRVIISPFDPEEMSEGGIVIPDVAQEKPTKGRVTAVGEGKLLDNGTRLEMNVAEGDVVIYGKWAGTKLEADGKELVVLKQDEILAKVE